MIYYADARYLMATALTRRGGCPSDLLGDLPQGTPIVRPLSMASALCSSGSISATPN